MGGGAEADGHLLDDDRHAKCQDNKREEEADTEPGTGSGIGKHAGAIILSQHDEDTGADEQPQQASSGGEAALGTGGGDANAIVGAVDVFVSDDYDFVLGLGGDGLHRLRQWPSGSLHLSSGRDLLSGD